MDPIEKVLTIEIDRTRRNIELMKTGVMFTSELKDGQRVDTTTKTIDEETVRCEGLVGALDRHNKRNA